MERKEILRTAQINRIRNDMQYKKVAYFCAHTGWGKTTLLRQYFTENKLSYCYLSCDDENFCEKLRAEAKKKNAHVMIDDVHEAHGCEGEILAALSGSKLNTKFYILGRRTVPSALKPFLITGQMVSYDYDFFAFSAKEIEELFRLNGKNISALWAKKLREGTEGWFFGISAFLNHYAAHKSFDEVFRCGEFDLYEYFNARIWDGFGEEVKSFLLKIGHLVEFDEEQAMMVCGNHDIKPVLHQILSIGVFLTLQPPDKYLMIPLFHRYLMWKQKSECSKTFLARQYEATALSFVLKNNVTEALKYYSLADNQEKVAELLLKNAEKHAGNGYFYKLRDYYFSLPEHIIDASPELMSAICMIYSLLCQPDKSEIYYNKLELFERETPDSERKKTARDKLAYLRIGLPHRGIHNIADILKSYAPSVLSGRLSLQDMSVTGNMPSLMNGGKDFCEWSKKDRILYHTLKAPLLLVLGKSSSGLAEIALGESLFEKNKDGNFTEELTLLNSGYYDAETGGNIQLQFAAMAVIARIYLTIGNAKTAVDAIETFKSRIGHNEEILDNIEAFLAYLAMLTGNYEKTEIWFHKKSPDENNGFCIVDRYRYLTKIKVYIMKGMYSEALSLLSRADTYFKEYDRIYCHMEALFLRAIVLYKMKDGRWEDVFAQALEQCEEYRFVRIVSKYGISILELLKSKKWNISKEYYDTLLANTQKQALLYPKYLKIPNKADYNLTDSEKRVLRLICYGLTNDEIANITTTTVRTVKFHLTNIYAKLEVKGRTEAINLCLENEILR